jgi:hypothetical protein
VVHTFGPDHLQLMSVDKEGKLTARPERHTVNTTDWPNRGPTMAVLSPDGKFLIVGTTFDELPSRKNPDGSVILWIPHGPDGTLHVIASNAPDPNGLVVFPVRDDGTLGAAKFQDAKGASPFYVAFLNRQPDTFVIGYAVSDACALAKIDKDGNISVGPLVKIDTSAGLPSELCWLAVSPDDRFVYTTNFGYSTVSSFRIDGGQAQHREGSRGPEGPGRWHLPSDQFNREQRTERQLAVAGWRLFLPDLRECREAGGLRDAARRFAQADHHHENSLQ